MIPVAYIGDTAEESEILIGALLERQSLTAAFDPEKHPKVPAGTSEGGQWASKQLPPAGPASADDMEGAREERNGPNAKLDDWFFQMANAEGEVVSEELAHLGDFSGDKQLAARTIADRLADDPDYHQESFMKFMDPFDDYVDFFAVDNPGENTAALAIHQWAQSSSDTNAASLLLQQEAAAEFGTEFNVREVVTRNAMSWPSNMSAVQADHEGALIEGVLSRTDPLARSSARAFIRAQYANTQEQLAALGIQPTDEVTLFRGMKLDERQMDALPLGASLQQVRQRPLTSWSTEYGVARDFSKGKGTQASAVIAAKIPASRIVGMAGTGAGCLGEFECVIASDSDPDDVTMVSGFHGQDIPESWEDMVLQTEWMERNS